MFGNKPAFGTNTTFGTGNFGSTSTSFGQGMSAFGAAKPLGTTFGSQPFGSTGQNTTIFESSMSGDNWATGPFGPQASLMNTGFGFSSHPFGSGLFGTSTQQPSNSGMATNMSGSEFGAPKSLLFNMSMTGTGLFWQAQQQPQQSGLMFNASNTAGSSLFGGSRKKRNCPSFKRRSQKKRALERLKLLTSGSSIQRSENDHTKGEIKSIQNIKEQVDEMPMNLNKSGDPKKTSKETRAKIADLETALKENENKLKLLENEVKDKEKEYWEKFMSIIRTDENIYQSERKFFNDKIENLKINHEAVLKKKDAEVDKLQLAYKKLEESLAAINNVKKTPATQQVNAERSILKDKPTPIESRKRVASTCEQNDSETSASDCMEVDLAVGCLVKRNGTGSTATLGLPNLGRTPMGSLINSVFRDPKPTPRGKPVDVSPKAKKPKTTGFPLPRRRGPRDCLSPII